MEVSREEQYSVIQLGFRLKHTASETYAKLQQEYNQRQRFWQLEFVNEEELNEPVIFLCASVYDPLGLLTFF